VKTNLCSVEKPFKIQKNGVFLFGMPFFVLEILPFFDLIFRISGNIEAVLLKLVTTNVHHKRNKVTPLVLLP